MKIDPLENIISAKKAAELWGMSESNVKTLAQEGKIYAKKIGTTWVVDKYQQNPKTYTKKRLNSTHYEAMKLNVPVFQDFEFTKNPALKIYEKFEPEQELYTVNIYFLMKILSKNGNESLYRARFLLMDFLNGEPLDMSFEYDDLITFENDFIVYVKEHMKHVAMKCRDNFIK